MDKYFSDDPSFTCLDSDLTKDIISKVSNWAEKWLEVGEINADVMEYVLNFKAQPAKNYGLKLTNHAANCVLLLRVPIQLLPSYLLSLRDFWVLLHVRLDTFWLIPLISLECCKI